jgi:5-methylcytosine-specific restriction protein A
MTYIFQRIIQNHFQWTRPSPGRLGSSGEGEYVQENGFGHEDWNFNKNLIIDKHLYGYCYYSPSESRKSDTFNIAFATYVGTKWHIVGFYLSAIFVENPPADPDVINRKTNDLIQLGNSLGITWRNLSEAEVRQRLQSEAQNLKWSVLPDNAVRTQRPIPIPKALFYTKNFRIVRPTEINQATFDALHELAGDSPSDDDYAGDEEFPEGRAVEIKHKMRERNQAVIQKSKEIFKKENGRLYCQVCGFDFERTYGEIGTDFIEAHHTVPVSDLQGVVMTRVKDIALVCSNCHRMLHRKRPWLEMSRLMGILTKRA